MQRLPRRQPHQWAAVLRMRPAVAAQAGATVVVAAAVAIATDR
jgi:hypothetical protein